MSTTILVFFALFTFSSTMPPQSHSSSIIATTIVTSRRNFYTNNTCPLNCTCSSYQPQKTSNLVQPSILNQNQQQFETLSPKQIVDCDRIEIDNVKDIFATLPDGVTSFALRRAGLTSLIDLCCMDDLESLDLSFNRISDLIVYVEFEKLTFLNLRSNSLRILRKDEFISFPNVEILNVDSNDIEIVDQESFRLMRLQQLYLSQNKIAYVNERAFRYAANLELLNLSANRLTSIHARNFYFSRRLRSLDLSNNRLSHLDEFAFEPLYRLEELNLSFNNLTRVPSTSLQKLTSLKSLIFDGNLVSILENASFTGLTSLETLRLDQLSELRMILDGAFDEMPRLRRLSLSSCKRLEYISAKAFGKNMGSLSELYLTNNALTFLPASILRIDSLSRSDFSGNPFNCECMRKTVSTWKPKFDSSFDPTCHTNENRIYSLFASGARIESSKASECRPVVAPTSNSNLSRPIGASVSLYCSVIDGRSDDNDDDDENRYRPMWTLPDGRRLTSGHRLPRFVVDHEKLTIAFLLQDDGGRYSCSLANRKNETRDDSLEIRYVDLRVDSVASIIVPVDVSAYYVTWTWSQGPLSNSNSDSRSHKSSLSYEFPPMPPSRHHRPPTPPGDCRLMFKSETDQEFVHIDLPALWERYTVNRLRPETNYSFCLVYARDDVALYKYCTQIRTDKAYLHFGVSLNYSLIALLAVSISLICALCVARCVHKRLHIWQEEKYRGRLQESMSAQGFLSSFESLNSGSLAAAAAAAVTYENHGAVDTVSQHGEAETTLNEIVSVASTARISCRKTTMATTGGTKMKKGNQNSSSTIVVETHCTA